MVVKIPCIAVAAAVISSYAPSGALAAAGCNSEVITYQATGRFGPNVVEGPDKFKLADMPFSITISVCGSKTPTDTGLDYAAYSPLVLTGSVTSGLTGQPTAISQPLVLTRSGYPVSCHWKELGLASTVFWDYRTVP
jgi:hypothetical protein